MGRDNIKLITFGHFDDVFLQMLRIKLQNIFEVSVSMQSAHIDLIRFFDAARKQYNGHLILKELEEKYTSPATKTIGLLQVDIFIPILTYIFGQAQLGGAFGIVSNYRLGNERYGLPRNSELLHARFTKILSHELGHAFGLIHCRTPACVMQPSTYIEDIDQKNELFCQNCKHILNRNCNSVI